MYLLKVVKIDNPIYYLADKYNIIHEYKLFLSDVEPLQVDDLLFVGKRFMDKSQGDYVGYFAYGSCDSQYGRKINSVELMEEEVIAIMTRNKLVFLKRFYG